jgi:hypothetical protein
MTEREVLLMALKPEVSSTTHLRTNYGHSPNTGVGLSMMKELTALSLGEMALISGDTWWYQKQNRNPEFGGFNRGLRFDGTLLAAAFVRNQIDDYQAMIREAWIRLGLQPPEDVGRMFL